MLMVMGASLGLGQAIATECAKTPLLLLTAMTVKAVLVAQSTVQETPRAMKVSRPSWMVHKCFVDVGDLATLEEVSEHIGRSTASVDSL